LTPEDERELFKRLAQIERRLAVLGAVAISGLAFILAYYATEEAEQRWGIGGNWEWWIGCAVLLAVVLLFGLSFRRSK
jgi:hypothetical protein